MSGPPIQPWRQAASELGGTLALERSRGAFWEGELELPSLRVELDGVQVTGGITFVGVEDPTTRLSARAAGSTGLGFHIYRGELVRTNDLDYATAWFGGLQAPFKACPHYGFNLLRETLRGLRNGAEDDAAQLVAAVRTVAALAGRGAVLLGAWSELARAVGGHAPARAAEWRPGPSHAIAVPRGAQRVIVDGWLGCVPEAGDERRLFTRVYAERTAAEQREPAPELVERAQPTALVDDPDTVAVYFAGLVTDSARIEAAISLVAAVAFDQTTAGPYR